MASLKLDENLPAEVTALFRNAGHDVLSVLDQALGGHPDEVIAAAGAREHRVIVTLDLGFADIRSYPPQDFYGILVLRLRSQDKSNILQVIQRLLPKFDGETLTGRLWIVDDSTIRIRG